MRRPTWFAVGCLLGLVGCNDDNVGITKVTPNRPPETRLSGGPAHLATATPYRVHLYWSGFDPDGSIDHYDFILVDHAPPFDSVLAPVVVAVPAPDDPRWLRTSVTDSIFVTAADSLPRDPRPGPGEDEGTIRDTPFERWHTFFIRAVDNEGLPDRTPDYRTFNSTNIAPTVSLLNPVKPGHKFNAPSTVVFNWTGQDPTATGEALDPVAARWVIIPTRVSLIGDYLSFPDSLHHLPKRGDHQFEWSPWRRWDASDGSGRRAVIRGLRQRETSIPDIGYYIFAVQAIDEAGAVTPVFDWVTTGKNNVSLVSVSGRVGPMLMIDDRFLGRFTFIEGAHPVRLDIAAGQPLNLCWSADASHYGGSIDGYRYAWDIIDVENDAVWSSWATSITCAPKRSFQNDTHRFYLQVRDNANNVLQATIEFTVHSVSLALPVLWIDDTAPFSVTSTQEASEDELWINSFESVARQRGFAFEAGRDVFDTRSNSLNAPHISTLFNYKAVVWSVRAPVHGSALARLARFVDPFDPANVNTVRWYNYLMTYLRGGGKLWINGFRPANELWPLTRPANFRLQAINILDWDPTGAHPFVDSVGVYSLLYEMGVEMWDCGGGTGCLRSGRNHYCRSVVRAAPQGTTQPAYVTSALVGHTHLVQISTLDVDATPPTGQRYTTSVNHGHSHQVELTQADFLELQRGNVVTKETTEDATDGGEVHRHTVEIIDRFGLWGAPVLTYGPRWDQGDVGNGQANIEVYNMPGAMAAQQPPLRGRDTVISLYVYGSGTPQTPSIFFPNTADMQPVFLLTKRRPEDHSYSRAFMGFEAELLSPEAHERLVDFIVWRHFRVDRDDF